MNAIILVDIQNDFLPTGNLPVPQGDEIIDVVNPLLSKFEHVIATQDWHPANHGSFASQHDGKDAFTVIDLNGLDQVLWPDHCVQDSKGANFAPGLHTEQIQKVVQKGTDPSVDSYSGFADNGGRIQTELDDYLRAKSIDTVYVCGLALDYCVQFTAHDALKRGYTTYVITDACRGIDPAGVQQALQSLEEAGAVLVSSTEL